MKKVLLLVMLCAIPGMVFAGQIVDFSAVNLRPANDGTTGYAYLEEYADGTGIYAQTTAAGQKVYYGTDYFNGWQLNRIESISFTFKDGLSYRSPYTNFVITDGAGAYGVISSQGGYTNSSQVLDQGTPETDDDQVVVNRTFYVAGDSGNQAYGFKFYEPVNATWAHGTSLVWDDIDDWYLLGIGDSRPLSAGEGTQARGPVDDGIAIVWGDSQDNYLGYREIYDVTVVADGREYCVGVVPVPGALLMGLMGTGVVTALRRKLA